MIKYDHDTAKLSKESLERDGFKNVDAPDITELSSKSKIWAVYCSSHQCHPLHYGNKKGKAVYVGILGNMKDKCPICNSEKIFCEIVTEQRAEYLKKKYISRMAA